VTEWAERELSTITDLGKFDLHEDAFLNLLAQSFGVLCVSLGYLVRPDATPAKFAMNKEERM
jgi:hypothetical protein